MSQKIPFSAQLYNLAFPKETEQQIFASEHTHVGFSSFLRDSTGQAQSPQTAYFYQDTQRLGCNCPWKVWWTQEKCYGKKAAKHTVGKQQLTLSSEPAWHYLGGPATGHAGRQWQHDVRGEGTSTSPVVWSLSALRLLGGNSTPLSWTPKAKGNERGYSSTMQAPIKAECAQFHSKHTRTNKSWVCDAETNFVNDYKEHATGEKGCIFVGV